MQKSKCNKDQYTFFLLSEPKKATCTKLSESLGGMSHDAVNRFLLREDLKAKDLFDENKNSLKLEGGVLSVDDSVIDKKHTKLKSNDLVSYQYSGLHKTVVKGIGLITLFYTDNEGIRLPVNFRIYQWDENKTKNQYFLEMVEEVIVWGIKASIVTGDSWYSSTDNLKNLRDKGLHWVFALKSNRLVSEKIHEHKTLIETDIPANGKILHLKGYGKVKIFCRTHKDESPRYYATDLTDIDLLSFERYHKQHWAIESYHRAIKQLCQAGTSMLRNTKAQLNHFFCVLRAFCFLEIQVAQHKIQNWYSIKNSIYRDVVKSFILSNLNHFSNA